MKPPGYRVRLFLSVDLTGSTAYKNNTVDTLQWVKTFETFYRAFPTRLKNEYNRLADGDNAPHLAQEEKEHGCPLLWKTIGDEILFCCKLTSLPHLSLCAYNLL